MKDQKKSWSRRHFLGSAALGMAGMVVIPNLATSCKGKTKAKTAEAG